MLRRFGAEVNPDQEPLLRRCKLRYMLGMTDIDYRLLRAVPNARSGKRGQRIRHHVATDVKVESHHRPQHRSFMIFCEKDGGCSGFCLVAVAVAVA